MKKTETDLSAFADSPALVVDDESASREILIDLLKELGFSSIIEKSSGHDALNFLEKNPQWRGLVLSDWNMPEMSGAELYLRIKNEHPDIPFIIVTGRNDEQSVMFAKDSGIYAYILKPFSVEELERKIIKVSLKHTAFLFNPEPSTSDSSYSI